VPRDAPHNSHYSKQPKNQVDASKDNQPDHSLGPTLRKGLSIATGRMEWDGTSGQIAGFGALSDPDPLDSEPLSVSNP
jgi:hypothetical protein